MGIIFAFMSAIGWGIGNVFAGLGLCHVKALPGSALSMAAGAFTLALITFIVQPRDLLAISGQAMALFATIGVFSFALGRFINYAGIKRIGAARATSVTASAPLFASLLAIIILKETPNLLVIGGTVLVVGGLYLTMSGKK